MGPLLLALAGCAGIGGVTDSLGTSIASQRDPDLVRDAAPAYLIMADTLARRSPDDADAQFTAARMYATYAASFVEDPERRRVLSDTAREYARAGLCLSLEAICAQLDARFPAFREALQSGVGAPDEARHLYRFASAWAGWVQARSDDYEALADLPKIEAAFERVIEITPEIDHGFAHVYLGVLLAQRPASLGGSPDAARERFERAIAISDGRNLMAKTLYAEHYARLVFDRALHDRLVSEVLAADAEAGDLTLSNRLAQERADRLRTSADAFF
jgi:tetratricopeptide (TPR) repeat protein